MSHEQFEPQLQLVEVSSDSGLSAGRRWFNQVVLQCSHPALRGKPDWVRLPDRVWQRQSALLVSLRERKRHS